MNVCTVALDGEELRVATSPGMPGTRPLLMFNGLGADLELLRGFAGELGALGIGIVLFDIPGIGGSRVPAMPYRFADIARLAYRLLERLEIAGPVDILGLSWGGAAAQEFAYRYPRRVRRLLLAATSAGAFAVPSRMSAWLAMLDVRSYTDRAHLAHVAGELYGGKITQDPELAQRYAAALRPVGCSLQLLAVCGWTSVFWLHRLRAPALVLMGTDDPLVPLANGRILVALLPRARLVTIRDGHLFLVTSARECAPVVAAFLLADAPSPNTVGQAPD